MDIKTFRKITKRTDEGETVLVRLKTRGGYWSNPTSKYEGSTFEVVKGNLEKRTLQVTATGLARKLNYGYRNLIPVEVNLNQVSLNLTALVVAEKEKEDLPTPTDTMGKTILSGMHVAFSHTDGHMAIGKVLEVDSENRVVWEVTAGTNTNLSAYRHLKRGKVLKTRNSHEKMVIV